MEPALPIDESLLEDLPEDGDIMSMSAEQYLAWVRSESNKLPGVVRIEVSEEQSRARQTAYMPAVGEIPQCPDEFMPSDAWANDVSFKFSQLRGEIYNRSLRLETRERKYKVPAMKDEANWRLFCFGVHSDNNGGEESTSEAPAPEHTPDMDVASDSDNDYREIAPTIGEVCMQNALAMTFELEEGEVVDEAVDSIDTINTVPGLSTAKQHIMREFLLDDGSVFQLAANKTSVSGFSIADVDVVRPPVPGFIPPNALVSEDYQQNVAPSIGLLLQFDQVLTSLLFSYHVGWLDDMSEIPYDRGAWLYAIMARLLKPLPGDVASDARRLYRLCCNMRYLMVERYIVEKNRLEIQNGSRCGPVEKDMESRESNVSSLLLEEDFEAKLGILNTIIVITGLYFGQGEDFAQLSET